MVSLSSQHGLVDSEQLLQELVSAQILMESDLGRLTTRFQLSYGEEASVGELASFLIQSQLLTEFQATLALNGLSDRLNIGPYLLLEPTTNSGFGTPYRAVRRSDQTPFTLATIPLRNLWNGHEAKRHLLAITELPSHPTLVPLQDLDTAKGVHYFAWPEIAGESFASLVDRAGSLPPAHANRFMLEIAEGLAICHRSGLIHGTLNPNCLLLGPDRKPRILDLGLGLVLFDNLHDSDSMLDTLSRSRLIASMLDCIAPEVIEAQEPPSPASDIYSFGCVLYFLLTGSLPFPASNLSDQLSAHLLSQPTPARELTSAVSSGLSELLDQILAKKPEDRPESIDQIRDRLSSITEGKNSFAIAAPPVPNPRVQFAQIDTADTPSHRGKHTIRLDQNDADAGTGHSINFNLPASTSADQASFELAISGAYPLPGLEEVESVEDALIRATNLAVEVKNAEETAKQELGRKRRHGFLSGARATSSLDAIPDPVTWVANQKSNLQPSASESHWQPKVHQGFWSRALRALKFWGPPTDLVQISLFGPQTIIPGQSAKLLVYLHLPEDFHNVKTLSRAMQDQIELLAVGNPDRLIPREHELGLHLSVANGGVAKSVFRFPWEGKPKSFTFDLLVPWESPPGRSPAVLSLGLDNVLAGRIPFAITIRARAGS